VFTEARASPRERLHRWFDHRAGIYAAIFVGGFIGGALRYLLDKSFPAPSGTFPWTIFLVNVGGSFGLTLLLVLIIDVWQPGPFVRPLLATGLIGAFTTFSTYVLAADQLWARGNEGTAVTYVVGSIVAGLAAASVGLVIGRAIITVRIHMKEGPDDAS
jgi:fluoride exporter